MATANPWQINDEVIAYLERRLKRSRIALTFFLAILLLGVVLGITAFIAMKYIDVLWVANVLPLVAFAALIAFLVGVVGSMMNGDLGRFKAAIAIAKHTGVLGLHFSEEIDARALESMWDFQMFRKATQNRGYFYAVGKIDGWFVELFHHHAAYGVGKYSINYLQTVAILHKKGLQLPDFMVLEKGWVDALKGMVGIAAAQLPDNDRFNERFVIRGRDLDAAIDRMTPDVAKLILDHGLTVEVQRDTLLVFQRNRLVEPEGYPQLARVAVALASALDGDVGDPENREAR